MSDYPFSFPVLHHHRMKGHDCPKSIPWDLVEGHEAQARLNHSQSLRALASRGGLDPIELKAVLQDQKLPRFDDYETCLKEAIEFLKSLVNKK